MSRLYRLVQGAVVMLAAFSISVTAIPLHAQESCTAPADAISALDTACASAAADAVCTTDGQAVPVEGTLPTGSPQIITLSGSSAADSLSIYLLGGATVTAYTHVASAQIEISNRAGYNVNLRSGPGSTFSVVGIFHYDDHLYADGQSQDGQWIRVVRDNDTAWVGRALVAVDPALDDLPVVDANTSTTNGHALTLTPGASACASSESAVVLATHAESSQHVTINDMPVAVTAGEVYIRLEGTQMTFYALSGRVSIGVGNPPLHPGDVIAWAGDLAVPNPAPPLPDLALFNALPIAPDACLIQPAQADLSLQTVTTAGGDQSAGALDGMGSIPAAERTNAGGEAWLHIAGDYGSGWVRAADVTTVGGCDALPDPARVSAPDANVPPDQIMLAYLNARVAGDGGRMQQLACVAYDSTALIQSQSFRAMRAELQNVTCSVVSQSGDTSVVHCDGTIQTEYNGALRQWELGSYQLTREGGAWRVCGEAN